MTPNVSFSKMCHPQTRQCSTHPGELADEKELHPISEMSAEERGCLADKGRLNLLEHRPVLLLRCKYRGPGGSCMG